MPNKTYTSNILFCTLALSLLFLGQAGADTISGTVYAGDPDEGAGTMGIGRTVRIKVNGAGDFTDTTDASGDYSIDVGATAAGDILTVFIDDETEDGTTVTRASGADINDLDIYQDHVIVRSDDGSPLTVIDTDQYDNEDTGYDGDIHFRIWTSGPTIFLNVFSAAFYIRAGDTFETRNAGFNVVTLGDDVNIKGTYDIKTAWTFTFVSGSWYNSGIYANGSATASGVIFDSGSGQEEKIKSGNNSFNNVEFDDGGAGTTWVLQDALNVNNGLTITSGTLDVNAVEDFSINVENSWFNDDTFEARKGTVILDNDAAESGTIATGGSAFYNLVINPSAAATYTLRDTLEVDNNLTITTGTLDTTSGESNSIRVEGDWTNDSTFTARNGTVTFDDDQANSRTITTGGSSFYNLVIYPGAAATYTLDDSLEVDNDLVISSGTLDANAAGNYGINVKGSWTNSGTFLAREGTVEFDDDQSTTHTIRSGGSAFGALWIDSTGSNYVLEDALDVDGYLWVQDGTLDTKSGESHSINIAGHWIMSDGSSFVANKSIVTFDNSQSTTSGMYSKGIPFYDLTINGNPGAVYLLEETLDVDNDLTVTAGTLDTHSAESNTITIAGDWTNSDTFRAQGGLVTFDGAAPQTVTTGGSDWNDIEVTNPSTVTFVDKFTASNFTCEIPGAQLNFKYKATNEKFEITNHLSLQGDSDKYLYLRRFGGSGSDDRWDIYPSGGSWTVDYVDVSNSINSYSTYINPSDSQDSGSNNFNWFSQEGCFTQITPSSSMIDSEGSIQFSASNGGACSQTPAYNWSVTSSIGSTINENGIYIAGANNTANSIKEDVKVNDTANSVTDTVVVCVIIDGCSVAVSPSSQTIASRGTIQFSATNTGCTPGTLTWELTSSIGSTINTDGLYTAGTNSGATTFVDTITLTDTSNCVIDTATVTIPGYQPPLLTTSVPAFTSTTTSAIATATTTIPRTTTTTVPCELRLTPQSGTANKGETITFEVTSSGECDTSEYEWSLSSNTDSSIEAMGTTCIYTAGKNDTSEPLTDTIIVEDIENGEITASASVIVNSAAGGSSLNVFPNSLEKPLIIPSIPVIYLEGTGTNFDLFNSVMTIDPPTALWPLFTMVTDSRNIFSFVVVLSYFFVPTDNETVTITVKTGDLAVSAKIDIALNPLMGE